VRPAILYFCACGVGFGSLVLEQVVFKVLSVHLGTTHTAMAIVLAAYMTGMGSGFFVFGKWRSPLFDRVGGLWVNQLAACITIVLTVPVLNFIDGLFLEQTSTIAPYFFVFLTISIPAFFLGGALPLLYRILLTEARNRGKTIGHLSGWNTVGGIGGIVCSTFWFVPMYGLFLSSLIAAAGSLLIVAILLLGQQKKQTVQPQKTISDTGHPAEIFSLPFLLFVAASSGFCGLASEIIWMRIVSTFVPNRAYSFGIVLGIYLLGYAIGNFWSARLAERPQRIRLYLYRLFISLGIIFLLAIPLTRLLPDFLYHIRFYLIEPWKQFVLPPGIISFFLIFPSTVVMGTILPLLVALFKTEKSQAGQEVGMLYGINIFSSILGSLSAGFIFLPIFGSLRTNLLLGMVYTSLGIAVFITKKGRSVQRRRLAPLGIAFTSFLCALSGIVFYSSLPKPLPVSVTRDATRFDELHFFKETSSGTISVVEDKKSGIRWSFINNSAVCGTTYDALKVVRILAHLPMLAHPDPKEVLVIGFGLGITAGNVLSYDVDHVDCVELCPEIVEAAPLFQSFNRNVLEDQRISIIGGDGRTWLKRTAKKYDVITCDPTHPALGSGNLYTREYFQLIKTRLSQQGVFVQYFPFRFITPAELQKAIATFHQAFPQSSLWLGYSHGVMLGSADSLQINPDRWSHALNNNPARYELMRSSLSHVYDWLSIMMMGPQELADFCANVQPVTDDKPILEYPDFHSLHPFTWAENMSKILEFRSKEALLDMISEQGKQNTSFMTTLDRFFTSKTFLIQGSIARGKGNFPEALRLLKKARTENWDDAEARNLHTFLMKKVGQEKMKRYLQQNAP